MDYTYTEELAARDTASDAYHDHPSHAGSCQTYKNFYRQDCPCENKWEDHAVSTEGADDEN